MSAVLKFPDRFEYRQSKAEKEARSLAALHGYGPRARDQFAREAKSLARFNPHLSPSACAARSVPPKTAGIGDVWDDLPDGAA